MISPNSTSLTQSVAHPPTVETDMKYTRNITNANIGSASSLFVTTLSILSETLSFPDETLFTHFLVMFPVKLYLSEVIMLSVSSSISFSRSAIILSVSSATLSEYGRALIIFSSFSKTLSAYHLVGIAGLKRTESSLWRASEDADFDAYESMMDAIFDMISSTG